MCGSSGKYWSSSVFKAIELSDVSLMAPLRSLTLPLILVLAYLTIGEKVSLSGVIGVIVLVVGLYLVGYEKGPELVLGRTEKLLAPSIFSLLWWCSLFVRYAKK